MAANPAARLDAVHYAYPGSGRDTLSGISLAIPAGKITALLGPNGSGKSTLLDIMLGWKHPGKGTVFIEERNLLTWSRRERSRKISLVPQNEPVQFSFTVLDFVMFGRAPHLPQLGVPGATDARISADALARVGIGHLERRHVTALSSGERQLMVLARSLAQQPSLLLLDEPTSNLDPGNTEKVLDILSSLSDDGLTVLFTTHDPSAAAEIADNVIMLGNGSVFAAGSPAQVLNDTNLNQLYGTRLRVLNLDGALIIYR